MRRLVFRIIVCLVWNMNHVYLLKADLKLSETRIPVYSLSRIHTFLKYWLLLPTLTKLFQFFVPGRKKYTLRLVGIYHRYGNVHTQAQSSRDARSEECKGRSVTKGVSLQTVVPFSVTSLTFKEVSLKSCILFIALFLKRLETRAFRIYFRIA